MKDRLWTKQYLLVIVTNFLLYVVYYQLDALDHELCHARLESGRE